MFGSQRQSSCSLKSVFELGIWLLEPRVQCLVNTPQALIQNEGCSPTPRWVKLVLGAPGVVLAFWVLFPG